MSTTSVPATDLDSRVRRLRELGSQLTNTGKPAAGARKLRTALRLLQWPSAPAPGDEPVWRAHHALTSHVLISLGLAEAELGDTARGLALLDAADHIVDDHDRAILLQQRGLVLHRAGRVDEALPLLDAAVPRLVHAGEPFALSSALLNRALLNISVGRIRRAREDLHECRLIAVRRGYSLTTAKVEHDLGYCEVLAGDIPAALRAFEVAGRLYELHGTGYLPVLAMDKARALLSAGLAREAGRELDAAFALFTADRLSVDYAWAELTRAQTALAAGDPDAARVWAARAGRRFRRHGDHAWSAIADLTAMRARLPAKRRSAAVGAQCRLLAIRLRELGLRDDADLADLLSARALLDAGRVQEARQVAALGGRAGPLEVRLLRRLLRARLHHRSPERALRELRSGLALLQTQRERWGSVELRAGVSGLGVELARSGLDIALSSSSPRLVFSWAERCRAQAFRARPVRPPADPEIRDALAELRQLSRNVRLAELRGRRDSSAEAKCTRLEHLIQQRGWQQHGGGRHRGVVSLASVQAQLAVADRVLFSFIDRDNHLSALAVDQHGAQLVRLGDTSAITEAVNRLLSDLDALCGRNLPRPIEEVIMASAGRQLEQLSREIVAPLRAFLGDREAVVVPTGSLGAIPWGLLPEFRGRPVTVVPSASVWLSAVQAERPSTSGIVLVGGPHLTHADAEIARIAAVRTDARCLTGDAATVEATLHALDGVDIAHLATHGHHQPDNVLFSCLDLSDGPLMAYDLADLAVAPRHVVLSACDVGRANVQTGDELLGFTAALLYAGTSTVVSSVARVPDDLAVDIMVAYHRALATGTEPARALAEASTMDTRIPLVCFGGG